MGMTKTESTESERRFRRWKRRAAAVSKAVERIESRFGYPWETEPFADLLARFAAAVSVHCAAADGGAAATEVPKPDADDVRAALRLVQEARDQVRHAEVMTIAAARDLDMTWKQIATDMGLESPQAAQQRYARRSDES